MKKIKIFDKHLYVEALRQLRTINVVVGVILLLQSILVPLSMFAESDRSVEVSEFSLLEVAPLLVLIALVMPLLANTLFSFLNSRSASDFYHALPVRRETMYITYLAAIFTSCLVLFIVPAVLEYVLFLPLSHAKLDMSKVGYVFADTMVIGMLITSALLIAKCITGTRFGTLAVMAMILFLPRSYLLYIREMVEMIHPFVILDGGNNFFWDTSWNLLFGWELHELRSIVYTLVLSVIYLIIAGILFIKRRSEKAESVSISSKVQLVLRILPALTASVLPIYFIFAQRYAYNDGNMSSEDIVLLVIQYIIVIVIYFLYELLTTRKLRSVVKAAPGLSVLLAANIVLILFIKVYGGYQAQICPSPEEVTTVRFMYDGYYGSNELFDTTYEDYLSYMVSNIEFQSDQIKELVINELEETQRRNTPYRGNDAGVVKVAISYNGKTIYRKIVVEDMDVLKSMVINDEQFLQLTDLFPKDEAEIESIQFYGMNGQITMSATAKLRIYDQAVEELTLLDNMQRYALIADSSSLVIYIYVKRGDSSYMIRLSIDPTLTPKTWELVEKYM